MHSSRRSTVQHSHAAGTRAANGETRPCRSVQPCSHPRACICMHLRRMHACAPHIKAPQGQPPPPGLGGLGLQPLEDVKLRGLVVATDARPPPVWGARGEQRDLGRWRLEEHWRRCGCQERHRYGGQCMEAGCHGAVCGWNSQAESSRCTCVGVVVAAFGRVLARTRDV